MINNKTVKPSAEISEGDIISIRFGEHVGHYEVLAVLETVSRDHAADMYRIIDEDEFLSAERNKA